MNKEALLKIAFRVGITVLVGLILIGIISLLFQKISTIYYITANSEIVTITPTTKPLSKWNIYGANVYDENYRLVESSFDGSLELMDNTRIVLERISNGPLFIEIDGPSGAENGYLNDAADQRVYTCLDYTFIEIKSIDSLVNTGTSLVFPINGIVDLGRTVDIEIINETSPVLREGNILMTGYSQTTDDYFIAGGENLHLGDRLVFDSTDAIGFVTVNENTCLQVAYRAEADEAFIQKPGPKNKEKVYKISASRYDRLKNDRFFQSISLLAASLVVLITFVTFIKDILNKNKE